MKIISATYTDWGAIEVVFEGQPPDTVILVPPDPDNMDYQALADWEAAGNTIAPFAPPPTTKPAEPTTEERLAALEAELASLRAA